MHGQLTDLTGNRNPWNCALIHSHTIHTGKPPSNVVRLAGFAQGPEEVQCSLYQHKDDRLDVVKES